MPRIVAGMDGSSHSRRPLQWAVSEAEVQAPVDQALSGQSGRAPPVTLQVIPGSPPPLDGEGES